MCLVYEFRNNSLNMQFFILIGVIITVRNVVAAR